MNDNSEWCLPDNSIYLNNSVNQIGRFYEGYIRTSGTYTLTEDPLVLFIVDSGTLTINGDVGIREVFLLNNTSAYINGRAKIMGDVWIGYNSKLCATSFDSTQTLPAHNHKDINFWCLRQWAGWSRPGTGPCYFDGKCYY